MIDPSLNGNRNGTGDHGIPAQPDTSTFKEYARTLRRHVWLVLGVATLCGALAAYRAYTDPPEYRSSAVIRLTNSRRMLGGLGGAGMVPGGYGDPILSQMEVLRSRSVTGMVVDAEGMLRLDIESREVRPGMLADVEVDPAVTDATLSVRFAADRIAVRSGAATVTAMYGEPVEVGGVRFAIMERPEVDSTVIRVLPRVVAAARLQDAVQTDRRSGTDIIDVGYTAGDPQLAQRVVNAMVERFQEFNAQTAQQEAMQRREFIEEQLARTTSQLRTAQGALASFRQREEMYSPAGALTARQAGLLQLDTERDALEAERQTYQSFLGNLRGAGGNATQSGLDALVVTPGMAANTVVTSLFQRLTQTQATLDSLTTGPGAEAASSPTVVSTREKLTTIRAQLVNAVANHIEAVETRLGTLNVLRQRYASEMRSLPTTETEEVRLLAEVEHLTTVSTQLRAEYQQARIEEAVQVGQVEIVDPALPGNEISAGRIRTVLFGLALGLMLGGGSAFLLENFNTSIRRKDEIEEVLHIPELAVIPRFGPGALSRARALAPMLQRNGNGNGAAAHGRGSELVTVTDAHTPAAEAYRSLRTNLIFSQSSKGLRRLIVTSSAPSEGKSTTASNLAAAFAQQGLQVLLVDCDLRKARLHKVFGVPREPGFSHLVLGLKEPDEVIRPTELAGLSFLPSGTLPPNPAELVGGEAMGRALDRLSERFDLVVLDTPPLLAASDAAVLARRVDGVLLVVRAGQTQRDAAQQAVRKLRSVGAHVLGAVLNDPDHKVGKHGGFYQYEYYGEKV